MAKKKAVSLVSPSGSFFTTDCRSCLVGREQKYMTKLNGDKMKEKWIKKPAKDIVINDWIIRNVQVNYEWVPGPYGAFIVNKIHRVQDEVRFICCEASGCDKTRQKFCYDVEELITLMSPSPSLFSINKIG